MESRGMMREMVVQEDGEGKKVELGEIEGGRERWEE